MDASNYGSGLPDPQPVDLSISASARADRASKPLSPLAAAIDDWEAAGFGDELLPALPPDAIVEEKLRSKAGKIPGRLVDGRCVGFVRWSTHQTTVRERAGWRPWPGFGLCLRTEKYPTFDVDIDDAPLAAAVVDLILARLPPGVLVRRRPGSSRVAIIMRSDDRSSKRRCVFTLPGDTREHAVELLWSGQQVVVAGLHRSGTTYQLDAPGLTDRTVDDLPCVSAEDIDRLLTEIVALVARAGGKGVPPKQSSRAGQAGAGARLDPYSAVMRAVCQQRAKWVPHLFGCFTGPADREWRLESVDLWREGALEEALCIYPHSIYDHGAECAYTPISLIMTFGRVEANGDISFGGAPEYGPKDGNPYAVVGEHSATVRRPTEAEAFAWLVRCLDGPPVPPVASRDVQMACLAAAVGLDWAALNAEDAQRFFSPVDAQGAPLPEEDPATWTAAKTAARITRVVALRALHPAEHERLQKARGLTDDDIAIPLELEETRARGWTPAAPSPSTPEGFSAPDISALLPPPTQGGAYRTYRALPEPYSIPLRQHVIYPRYLCGEVALTVAVPAAGKSTMAIHDALVIASGREDILRGANAVSPERLHRSGPVLVHDSEDPYAEMERRLLAAAQHHGVTDLPHPIHLWSGVGAAPLWLARRDRNTGALVPGDGADRLLQAIKDTGAVYAAIGPFAGLAEGMNENDAADCNMVMQIIAAIAAKTGCCINVIHHTSKSGGGEAGDMNAARGSSAIVAKARTVVTLNTMPEADAQRYGLTPRNHVVVHYAKVSHGPRLDGGIIYRREGVPIGNGAGLGGDPRGAFELSALDLLRAEGDYAPALSVVGIGSAVSREEVREQKRTAVEDGTIAAIIAVLDGIGRRALTDVLPELTTALREQRAIRGSAANTVREHLRNHLPSPGRLASFDGQDVRVKFEKDGPKHTDPWFLVVETTSESVPSNP